MGANPSPLRSCRGAGLVLSIASIVLVTARCSQGTMPAEPSALQSLPQGGASDPVPDLLPDPPSSPPRVLCAVGDLVHQGGLGAANAVARLARELNCEVLALLGDYAYDRSDTRAFRELFHPIWGDLLPRIRPVLGNHEEPADYFSYFGSQAGQSSQGYYSVELGNWLLVALNSETSRDGAQRAWLQDELKRTPARCQLMYWHIPLFSAGPHGPDDKNRYFFDAGHQAGVELALTAHNHNYQRFGPQTSDGRYSDVGIRQLVVGTGGAPLRRVSDRTAPNLERYDDTTFGLLKLTLSDDSYEGEFVPIDGRGFSDSFQGRCH